MFPGSCYPNTSGRLGLVAFLDQIKNIVGRCLSQLRNGTWLYCKHEKREAASEPTVLSIVKVSLVCFWTRLCKEEAFPFIALNKANHPKGYSQPPHSRAALHGWNYKL